MPSASSRTRASRRLVCAWIFCSSKYDKGSRGPAACSHNNGMARHWLTGLALVGFFSGAAWAVVIPAGADLSIRLTSAVTTAQPEPKAVVSAVLIAPVLLNGDVAIPAGAILRGRVKDLTLPADPHTQAALLIQFDSLEDPQAKRKANVSARLIAVDNARETVDADGKIVGIDASKTGSGRLDQGINKLSGRYPGLGELLGVAKAAVVKEADPNIVYQPGVEMTIELTAPLNWPAQTAPFAIGAVLPADQLADLVNSEPMRTMAAGTPRPSDLTNILVLGSREAIEKAFQAAGWFTAAQLNEASKLETFRAIAEMRGYNEAPVSTLLLEGEPPDLVFQKQNNTFAQRHHIRIWRRPGQFDGRDVWVCAATHDIGIDYSEADHTFIHKVDPNTDKERAKVVADSAVHGHGEGSLSGGTAQRSPGWQECNGRSVCYGRPHGSCRIREFCPLT